MASNFRQSLLEAAEQAARAGDIDRRDAFRLRLATALPRVRDQLERECCAHAQASGLAAANQSAADIDWSQLVAFLKELLPVVLEIHLVAFLKELLPGWLRPHFCTRSGHAMGGASLSLCKSKSTS